MGILFIDMSLLNIHYKKKYAGTNASVRSKLPVLTAKEKKAARGRERLRLDKEGKFEVDSLAKSSVTPMESGTDTESVAESTAADKAVFTAAKADALDITAKALDLEIANFDDNCGN